MRTSLSVLNGYGVTHIVELKDLRISIMISEYCFVSRVFNVYTATLYTVVRLIDTADTTGLVGCSRIEAKRYSISINVFRSSQQILGTVGKVGFFSIFIGNRGKLTASVAIRYRCDLGVGIAYTGDLT